MCPTYAWVAWKFSRVPEHGPGPQPMATFPGFVQMDPVNVPAKFEVRIALPFSEIIAIEVLGVGFELQSGERGS